MNSSKLKGYLTGLIIGDGYIDKGVSKRRFEIKSINEDFIDKIYNDLMSCTNFNLIKKEFDSYMDKNGVNHKKSYSLNIESHPYFAKKYHNFYDDYRKRIVSNDALKWLNEEGLANWYMSDGYVCLVGKTKGKIRSRRVDICTDRYSLETVEKISNSLKNRFNIETSVIKRDRFYRLRVKLESYESFFAMIRPHIVPSMMYKLYLGYEKQPKWMSDKDWEFQNSISAIALTSKVEG